MPHVSHAHRFVHLSIPYTKSTSTRKWLEREYGAEQVGYQHAMFIPDDCQDYFVWTVVRDPRDRAVSLWRRIHRGPEREKLMRFHFDPKGIKFPETFTDWMRMLVEDQPFTYGKEPEGEMQYWPQYQFTGPINHGPDRLMRYEDIPDRLHELPFVTEPVTDFPHYSRNGQMAGLTWEEVATPEAERCLSQWAKWDRDLYKEACR